MEASSPISMRRFLIRTRCVLSVSVLPETLQPNSVTHMGFQPFLGLNRRMMLTIRSWMSQATSSLWASARVVA